MNDIPPLRIIIIEAQSEGVVGDVLREIRSSYSTTHYFIEKVNTMGDTYNVNGQAGAVGPHAASTGDAFTQILGQNPSAESIANELKLIRLSMKKASAETLDPEQDEEIGQIAKAQIAAEKGDIHGVLEHLKHVGNWALTTAKDTGAEIVAKIIAQIIVPH